MKLNGDTTVSVGCDEDIDSKERLELENEFASTEAGAARRRRTRRKIKKRRNASTRLDNSNNNSITMEEDEECIDLTLDESAQRKGGAKGIESGDGDGGGGSKRQKVVMHGINNASKRQRVSIRGLNTVVANGKDGVLPQNGANKEGNRAENGGIGGQQQRHQTLESEQGTGQQEVGWASRIWGAVQRFARRI
jgi:hypothetical protein